MSGVAEVVLVVVLVGGGIIALQVFLSRKQSKWLGWILPSVSLICQIVMALSLVFFSFYSVEIDGGVVLDGQAIEQAAEPVREIINSKSDIITSAIYQFVLGNIPTVVLIGIYFACREGLKRNKEVDRMSIQDLE